MPFRAMTDLREQVTDTGGHRYRVIEHDAHAGLLVLEDEEDGEWTEWHSERTVLDQWFRRSTLSLVREGVTYYLTRVPE